MRRSALLCALVVGCSYPEFKFNEQAAPADATLSDVSDVSPTEDTAVTDAASTFEMVPPSPKGCEGSAATFCIDFSKAIEPHDGWTGKRVSPTSTLTIENTAPFSAPNNLLSMVKADPMGYLDASVYKTLTAPALTREARMEFRLKVPAKPGAGGRYLLFHYHREGAGDGMSLTLDGGGFFLEIHGAKYEERRTMMAVPIDTWMHVRIDAVLTYANGSARVWIDDMDAPVMQISGASMTETDSLERRVTVGIFANTPPNDLWARYDDVSFAWK